MTLEHFFEILKNYWSQIALILGILGYIIKIIFENFLKWKEIKFSHSRSAIINETKNAFATFDFFNYKICQVYPMLRDDNTIEKMINELEGHFIKLNADLLSLRILLPKEKCGFLDHVQEKMREIYFVFLISFYAKVNKMEIKEPGKGFEMMNTFYKDEYIAFRNKFENYLRELINT